MKPMNGRLSAAPVPTTAAAVTECPVSDARLRFMMFRASLAEVALLGGREVVFAKISEGGVQHGHRAAYIQGLTVHRVGEVASKDPDRVPGAQVLVGRNGCGRSTGRTTRQWVRCRGGRKSNGTLLPELPERDCADNTADCLSGAEKVTREGSTR